MGYPKIRNPNVQRIINPALHPLPQRFEHRPEGLPHRLGDDLVALGGGVDAVGEVEVGDAADVFEQERDQRDIVFAGQLRVEVAEAAPASGSGACLGSGSAFKA